MSRSSPSRQIGPSSNPWVQRGAFVLIAGVAVFLMRGWFSSGLDYARVGPRPAEGRKVLVLLHGYGAPAEDLVGLAEEIASVAPDVSILVPPGPYRVGGSGRSWIPNYTAANRDEYAKRLAVEVATTNALIWAVIEEARSKDAACGDIYVAGFSQGGRMAAEVALRAPPDCTLGGVIVLSGGGMDEVELPASTDFARMRVLVTHGSKDRVVAMSKGKAIVQHFQMGGHDVRWLEFDGAHTIPTEVREAIPAFLQSSR